MKALSIKFLENHELVIKCENAGVIEHRLFSAKSMCEHPQLAEGMRETWRRMLEAGDFEKAYVLTGDVVWPGRCEILEDELEKFTKLYVGGVVNGGYDTQG